MLDIKDILSELDLIGVDHTEWNSLRPPGILTKSDVEFISLQLKAQNSVFRLDSVIDVIFRLRDYLPSYEFRVSTPDDNYYYSIDEFIGKYGLKEEFFIINILIQ